MKKPSIKILQEFAKQYFANRCPVIRWKKTEDYQGLADLKNNIIYMNPKIGLNDSGCRVGTLHYNPRAKEKIKYKQGEQYFCTLLHEIAHFNIKKKPLKEWTNLKRKLKKQAKEDLNLEKMRRNNFEDRPLTQKEEKEYLQNAFCNNVEYYGELNRRKGENDSYYLGRCEDFRSWLGKDMASEHLSVEMWARKEFKKRRKEVRELLNRC